jgi:ferritin-like protein
MHPASKWCRTPKGFMSHEGLHEDSKKLSSKTIEMHRAIESLMEELEAMDWYNQRVDACEDEELKKILIHNRDEEKEHAVMMIEWIRRNDPFFEGQLKKRLFKEGPIAKSGD